MAANQNEDTSIRNSSAKSSSSTDLLKRLNDILSEKTTNLKRVRPFGLSTTGLYRLPWPYRNVLFSNRARENGIVSAKASQWLFNLVFTISTPYMIDSALSWSFLSLWYTIYMNKQNTTISHPATTNMALLAFLWFLVFVLLSGLLLVPRIIWEQARATSNLEQRRARRRAVRGMLRTMGLE
ncbi:hypothetical protein GTA08_BOTSDO08475 [Botryosphaeria dothidea]|uniref:Uncharacterized protein n=1 Tax=Botryosphaeria dothidea TaxID=55169 RepID=A0A8H4IM26_9PEZI|nr:hypothetical protein GTA08_BOTSDO08475 [Botryosphaeria dothidea]